MVYRPSSMLLLLLLLWNFVGVDARDGGSEISLPFLIYHLVSIPGCNSNRNLIQQLAHDWPLRSMY